MNISYLLYDSKISMRKEATIRWVDITKEIKEQPFLFQRMKE